MSSFATRGRTDGPIIVAMIQAAVWGTFGTFRFLMPTAQLAVLFHAETSLSGSMSVTATLAGINQITPNEQRGQMIALYSLLSGLVSVTAGPSGRPLPGFQWPWQCRVESIDGLFCLRYGCFRPIAGRTPSIPARRRRRSAMDGGAMTNALMAHRPPTFGVGQHKGAEMESNGTAIC